MMHTAKSASFHPLGWLAIVILINPQAHFAYVITNISRKSKSERILTWIAHTSQSVSAPQMTAKLNKPKLYSTFSEVLRTMSSETSVQSDLKVTE